MIFLNTMLTPLTQDKDKDNEDKEKQFVIIWNVIPINNIIN